jgi:hypothetical protein
MLFERDFVIENLQDDKLREIYYKYMRDRLNDYDDCEPIGEEELMIFCLVAGIPMVEGDRPIGRGHDAGVGA